VIKIRRVRKGDLSKIREVIEVAFAEFFEQTLGARPRQVFGGAQYVHHRWLMEPWGCFVAEDEDGKIIGANITVVWGTVGLFGPFAVAPSYQNQQIGQQLLKTTLDFFKENHVTLEGLAASPASAKHLVFYQKFGFKPKLLVAIMGKPLDRREVVQGVKPRSGPRVRRFSTLSEREKKGMLLRMRRITNQIYRGMDLTKEIEIVDGLALGDTLLLERERQLLAFAICHTPGMSEAPQGAVYVKFLAVEPARRRPEYFHELVAAAEELGISHGVQRVICPVYTGYWCAFQALLDLGFGIDFTIVRMKRGKNEDYEDPEDYVLDDWR